MENLIFCALKACFNAVKSGENANPLILSLKSFSVMQNFPNICKSQKMLIVFIKLLNNYQKSNEH